MPLDFNKLKQGVLNRKTDSSAVAGAGKGQASAAKKRSFSSNPKVEAFKLGLKDIKSVIDEGNYKLFLKQLIVLLMAFIGAKFLMGKMAAQKEVLVDKLAALSIQKTHQDDYLVNKDRLLRLEPLFPNMNQKGDWLLQTLMKAFDSHNVQSNIDGNVIEKKDDTRTVIAQDVTFQQGFSDLGKFLADIESGNNFVRISSIVINKLFDPAVLGENTIKARFNTVFPKEKYAKKLFKDYDKQMAQIAAESAKPSKGGAAK